MRRQIEMGKNEHTNELQAIYTFVRIGIAADWDFAIMALTLIDWVRPREAGRRQVRFRKRLSHDPFRGPSCRPEYSGQGSDLL